MHKKILFVFLLILNLSFVIHASPQPTQNICTDKASHNENCTFGVLLAKKNIEKLEAHIDKEGVFTTVAVSAFFFKQENNYKGCYYSTNALYKATLLRAYQHANQDNAFYFPLISIISSVRDSYIKQPRNQNEKEQHLENCKKGVTDFYLHIKDWNQEQTSDFLYNTIVNSNKILILKPFNKKAMDWTVMNSIKQNFPKKFYQKLSSELPTSEKILQN